MLSLAVAVAAFVLIHLLVSGTRVRDGLVARIGEGPYMGLFSLLSVAVLAWMVWSYGQARAENIVWWGPDPLRHVAFLVQLVGVLLIVTGLLTPNPTSVKQEGTLDKGDPIRGVIRITRHPFLWGVAIWAGGHLLVNGDLASVLLFGSLLFLGAIGGASIDAKRIRALGEPYHEFKTVTSNVPFVAILKRRQPLRLGEIGWRLPAALAVYALLFAAHPWIAGVSPLG